MYAYGCVHKLYKYIHVIVLIIDNRNEKWIFNQMISNLTLFTKILANKYVAKQSLMAHKQKHVLD